MGGAMTWQAASGDRFHTAPLSRLRGKGPQPQNPRPRGVHPIGGRLPLSGGDVERSETEAVGTRSPP